MWLNYTILFVILLLLFRTKDIIAHQLPKKVDQIVFCPLTETQKIVYKRFLTTPEVQTMLHREQRCDKCSSGKLYVFRSIQFFTLSEISRSGKDCHYKEWDQAWVFQFTTLLLKISNHLALILPGN